MSQLDLDGLVTQLAFGKITPTNIPALGMHISQEAVYLAETAIGDDGKLGIRHLVRVPFPSAVKRVGETDEKASLPSATAIEKDFLAGSETVVETLRNSLSQTQWATKNVVVTLSHQISILRYFTTPPINRKFWKSAIPLQAKKYIPIPFESLDYDFQIFPGVASPGQSPLNGVLFGVTAKNNMERVLNFVKKIGLEALSVEMACLSTLRFWSKARRIDGVNICCCVHFDGGNIRIIIADKGLPVFFREIYLGPQASLQDQRRLDLEGCVAFAQKQLGIGNVEAVFVSGSGAPLENWREAFAKELGIRAIVCDEAAPLALKTTSWEAYAALGSSLRFMAPMRAALDLGKVGKVSDEEFRTARVILALSLLVAFWFALIGSINFFTYTIRVRSLARYKINAQVRAVLAGKSESDISDLLKSMREQLTTLEGLSANSTPLTQALKDIGDGIPPNVWIEDISYKNSRALDAMSGYGSGASGPSLDLRGDSQADTPIDEQNAAYKFRDNLSASPTIGKMFKQVQISLQSTAQDNTLGRDASTTTTVFTVSAQAQKLE